MSDVARRRLKSKHSYLLVGEWPLLSLQVLEEAVYFPPYITSIHQDATIDMAVKKVLLSAL